MKRHAWLLVAIACLLAWQWWGRGVAVPAPPAPPAAATPAALPPRPGPDVPAPGGADVLPAEARQTLQLIRSGGPFPYERDGIVFGNYERHLPERRRGYYREYTVPTPGLAHRGARRIVAGGDPPREFWYTGDHYESFRRIEATP